MKIPYLFQRSEIYARPILPLLQAMIPGILIGARIPGHSSFALALAFSSMVIIGFALFKNRPVFIPPLLLFLGMGYLSIQPWIHPDFPSSHIIHYTDKGHFTINGTIVDKPIKSGRRTRFTLNVDSLAGSGTSFPVNGKIRVAAYGRTPSLFPGDRISFHSRIRSIRNFNNPDGFDYRRYMMFKKIWGTAYFSENRVTILNRKMPDQPATLPSSIRSNISGLIERTSEGDERAILKALIIGEKHEIPEKLRQAFNRTGISHLLAISGLHVGIVAMLSFSFFSRFLSYSKKLLWKAWIKKGAALLSLFPVVFYGFIAGMSPATQRAVIMVSVFMLALLVNREHDPVNTLALAAALILVVHPPSLFSVSFQLSFAAVFFILYGLSKMKLKKALYKKNTANFFISAATRKLLIFFMVSLFAILGTLPVVMYYFNQISIAGLFTNFLFVPVVGFIVVPVGLAAVFLFPLNTWAAELCLKVSTAILGPVIDAAYFISGLPFSGLKTITPTWLEISLFYLLFAFIVRVFEKNGDKQEGPADSVCSIENHDTRQKVYAFFSKQKAIVLAITLLVIVFCSDAAFWIYKRFGHDDLKVTVIDVGQGSSTLLEFPKGFTMLIDGGGFSDNNVFDMGKNVIAPLLWRKKIRTIDTLILSHSNSDHLNGLLFIAKHFHVKKVMSNHVKAHTAGYHSFLNIIHEKNIKHPPYQSIQRENFIQGVRVRILYPPPDLQTKIQYDTWRESNNSSVVVQVKFGTISFLIPGDLMAKAEEEIVAVAGSNLKSTVLLSPHHGSRTSSTHHFLSNVKPEIVVISVGWKNRFGFPHPSVIKRYQNFGAAIYRTDLHGAIAISTDGKIINIEPAVTQSHP